MQLLILYLLFAAAFGWVGHLLVRRWKHRRVSMTRRRVLLSMSAASFVTGLWFTNLVAFSIWAGGGPDTAHRDAHLVRGQWAVVIASASFLTAGATWPGRRC